MSEENGKVCCTCKHNIRTGTGADVECHCEVDDHYIGYVACMTNWCRKWAERKEE